MLNTFKKPNKKNIKPKDNFRLICNAIVFAFYNSYIKGWYKGGIYQGKLKYFCIPGLNCYSCPGARFSCPIGALQGHLSLKNYKGLIYVLSIISFFGLISGRFICGWLCPFGLFQDLLYKHPICKKRKNVPGHKFLTKCRYIILIVFVLLLTSLTKDIVGNTTPIFCKYICPDGTLLGGLPLITLNPLLRESLGPLFYWKCFGLLAITLSSIFYARPWCKYLCPLGAIYGCFNKISLVKIKIDTEKCIKCGTCKEICKFDIETFKNPNSIDCIRCGDCINACKESAISFGIEK